MYIEDSNVVLLSKRVKYQLVLVLVGYIAAAERF